MAADVPPMTREQIEIHAHRHADLCGDMIEAAATDRDEWYKVPAGYIDVCNVPIPVR